MPPLRQRRCVPFLESVHAFTIQSDTSPLGPRLLAECLNKPIAKLYPIGYNQIMIEIRQTEQFAT